MSRSPSSLEHLTLLRSILEYFSRSDISEANQGGHCLSLRLGFGQGECRESFRALLICSTAFPHSFQTFLELEGYVSVLRNIIDKNEFILCWVLGYCNVDYNEIADELARQGYTMVFTKNRYEIN